MFSKYIDPKNNPCDRRWFNESINLEKWAGRDLTLRFHTDSGPEGRNDWDLAYWGNIQLVPSNDFDSSNKAVKKGSKYEQVYRDKYVLIFKNTEVFPRSFVVHKVVNVSNFNESLKMMADSAVDLRNVAIVENLPEQEVNTINNANQQSPTTTVETSYINSGELDITVSLKTV